MVEAGVGTLEGAVDELLSRDLGRLSAAELMSVLVGVEQEKRRLAALDVALVHELHQRAADREHCRNDMVELLVTELRVSPAEAKTRVVASGALAPRVALSGEVLEPRLPRVAQAVAAGDISSEHVEVIRAALDRLPARVAVEAHTVGEQFLLDAARVEHPRALRVTARMFLARLDPDGREPGDDNENSRDLRVIRDATGWSTVRGRLTPAATAGFEAIQDSLAAPSPAQDGVRDARLPGQRRHDALYDMTRRLLTTGELPAAGGAPVTVLVRTLDPAPDGVLRRGALVLDHRGDLLRLHALLACPDVECGTEVVGIRVTDAGVPLSLGRTARTANRPLRRALAARDGGCCFPGCARPAAWTEAHHIRPWAGGGRTDLANLCLLCPFHHREFARRGWQVRMAGDGHPEWIPGMDRP